MSDATPRPWHWNESIHGWGGQLKSDDEGYSGDKYLDLALRGSGNVGIIDLRIDHYQPEWDQYPEDIKTADRQLIVEAVNQHDTLLQLVREMERFLPWHKLGCSTNRSISRDRCDCEVPDIKYRARAILEPEEVNEETPEALCTLCGNYVKDAVQSDFLVCKSCVDYEQALADRER